MKVALALIELLLLLGSLELKLYLLKISLDILKPQKYVEKKAERL
jgi:hypothetical protein